MLQPRLLNHSGTAVSILTHLAVLTIGLGYAGVLPFEAAPIEAITVDLVSPAEVKEATKQTPPEKPQPLDIPNFSAKDQPPQSLPPMQAAPPKQSAQQPGPSTPPPNPKPDTRTDTRQSTAQPQPATGSQPAPQPASPWLPNLPGAAQPDVSIQYQVNLGLPIRGPGEEFDAPAMSTAKVETSDIARFRDHLKTCSVLPAGVGPGDNVKIVIRATFIPNGQLRSAPILIEASASAKGPLLMQAAIKALQQCQPYAGLPADKYDEWKVLDLSFTPQDFRRG
jgi:hypothetical protein